MAGHNTVNDPLKEDPSSIDILFVSPQTLLPSNHNRHRGILTKLSMATTSSAPDTLTTSAPTLFERQNNPQDCQNLINASVDRATVEISRTIIRLNATFSQQLQQASIDKTNGINSAKNSATSTIKIVVESASSATSSAFFSLTLANRQATSANLALTTAQLDASSVSSASSTLFLASSSDVSRLSSSVALLQASITSLQACLPSS